MPLTGHDSFFGWVHGFKINSNNLILGAKTLQSPYPPVLRNPTFDQAFHNWNIADTSMFLFVLAFGVLGGYRLSKNFSRDAQNMFMVRRAYYSCISYSALFGFFFGIRNSAYRLEGLVPNGLPSTVSDTPVKYDYTTESLNNSFWSYFVSQHNKPAQQ